jgi:uncharacterized protein YqjF (DUF2071 family)
MTAGADGVGRHPTERVRLPIMYQNWNRITFLHWSYEPRAVQRLLPRGLLVDEFEGAAWVGITPFVLRGLTVPGIPPLPWLSQSPETNVRTYIRGPDGRRGIWFFSLDIARLPAMVVARAAFRLPYMWSTLSANVVRGRVRYRGRRRYGNGPASYDIEIEPTSRLEEGDVSVFDNFLTARWVLFTFYGTHPASVSAEHAPWPLWRANPIRVEQNLLAAAGLPPPGGEPVLHFSPGVSTRISIPRLITHTG